MGNASAHEAQNAAGAILCADRRPNPQILKGKVVMCRAISTWASSPGSEPSNTSMARLHPGVLMPLRVHK